MNVKEWLGKVAFVGISNIPNDDGWIYYSRFDGSYITRVGLEDNVKFLAYREITEQLTHGVGFSPKDGYWYGWSHRAIYGFHVGSKCKKGDCHYIPRDEKDAIEDGIRFWSDPGHLEVKAGEPCEEHGDRGVWISWEYSDNVPNEKIRGEIGSTFWRFPDVYGKGEWTAETMEDARQMAIDFNEGVS